MRIIVATSKGTPPGHANGKYVVLDFIDQGKGIFPEVMPRIFHPYYTTKETGSGLGMTFTYSTVKCHGGVIEVSSEMGKGTKITIFIPAVFNKVEPKSLHNRIIFHYFHVETIIGD